MIVTVTEMLGMSRSVVLVMQRSSWTSIEAGFEMCVSQMTQFVRDITSMGNQKRGQAQWYTPVLPASVRLKKEGFKLNAIMGYISKPSSKN